MRPLTCDAAEGSGPGRRLGERPLPPPEGRRVGGTLARVGHHPGAVLLVGPGAVLPAARPPAFARLRGAVRGDFLPLEPAGQRRLRLEVEVPAAAVPLRHLPQLQRQVPAQLVVVHRAEQAPADRLSAADGIHPLRASGRGAGGRGVASFGWWTCPPLWTSRGCGTI